MQINNLKLIPDWRLQDRQGQSLNASFLPLMQALQRSKKLTKAAKECGLSYRHAWNLLKEAEAFFDHPVVIMERGRGATLTELGKVLIQTNQRIEARLHTQLESLAMELNAEVHKALSDHVDTLSIHASHGYAVALIPKHLKAYQAELHYHVPDDALRALNAGDCKVAGFNLSLHHQAPQLEQRYRALLSEENIVVVQFIKRQQGLMTSTDNKQLVNSLADLQQSGLQFINRQPRSGTRELLDQLLIESNIDSKNIRGYDTNEYTHTAVAAHVATGMADIGFGVEAAAALFNLEFTPITEDSYYWAYRTESQDDPEIKAFLEMLKDKNLQDEIDQLPGYESSNSGVRISTTELFSNA